MRAAQIDPSPAAPPKSRLKRLFERQVLRVSPAERLPSAPAGGEKDDLSEPSSLCLDGMVRSFLEDGGGERGAAARCCNCFHAGDASDDEDGPAAAEAAAADIAETIKGLSRWDKSSSHPAGEHAYLDVLLPAGSERAERDRVLVDVDFRSAFEVARPTKAYRAVLQRLPSVFVGWEDRLRLLVAAAADAARASLKKRGLHLPPWRKPEYMRAKWLSPYDRETPPPLPQPQQPEAPTGELAVDGEGGGPGA
ncbi:uncharacterized protein C2845_PM01G03890 [Panicum miliaceum]|uniref:DUF506 family protein n=1 Tax=Panicum miliaceum TaxID=4540 RepID=A0A3L6TT47_PANMI|nr:uncharacterized protein C2845_PM01G03890 [Panicum miliaceum]